MRNRNEFEDYLKKHQWQSANEWLCAEIRFLRCKLTLQRIVYNTFGVLMSVVLAFFTWVVLFPSASEKELEAFPLATLCYRLFQWLCQAVPGGKAVVIVGLSLIPFLVSLILGVFFCLIRPIRNKQSAEAANGHDVKLKIDSLRQLYYKYDDNYTITLYTLLAGFLSGGVMVLSSAPGGLNPFEYIFVGLICSAVHFAIFFGSTWLFAAFRERLGVQWYPCGDWENSVTEAIEGKKKQSGSYTPYRSGIEDTDYYKEKYNEAYATYMGQPCETPEQYAKRVAQEIEDDLTGKGYGDY